MPRRGGLKGLCFSDGKRMQLRKMEVADSLQALQDQVGSAIAATDTGANQANGSNIEEILFVFPLCAFGAEQGDTEQSLVGKSVHEHLAVTRFENVKRQ